MSKPLNLVILTNDEMRGDAPGFMGNPDCKTPCLDLFAEKGIVFENHFTVHGKCVPSRVAMATGRYCHTDGFRTINLHLEPDQPNILEFLRRNGYEVSVFGLNHQYRTLYDSHTAHEGYADYHSFIEFPDRKLHDIVDKERLIPESKKPRPAADKKIPDANPHRKTGELKGFSDDARAEQAITYLREIRDKDKPFYMHVNLSAPHPGYAVEDPYYSMYDPAKIKPWEYDLPDGAPLHLRTMREIRGGGNPDEEALREIQAVYYGMISKTEMLQGQILAELESQGLMDNTIIIYTVDHGDFAGQYGLPEKWDTAMNDCIMHVPFVLYAPGLPQGERVKSLSEHTDLVPTVCELLGLEPDWGVHGESLIPILKGEKKKEAVFGDGGHEEEMWSRFSKEMLKRGSGKQVTYAGHPETMSRTKMVRTDKWKLVIRLTGGNELYDMKNDPNEMKNLYPGYEDDPALKDVVHDLQLKIIEWCLKTDTDRPYEERVGA